MLIGLRRLACLAAFLALVFSAPGAFAKTVLQAADEVERFIGRDAAADDEEYMLAGEGAAARARGGGRDRL